MHRPVVLLTLALTLPTLAQTPARPAAPARSISIKKETPPSPLATHVIPRLDSAQAALAEGDMKRAQGNATGALLLLATYGTDRDAEAFRRAAHLRRLAASLEPVDPATRQSILPALLANDELARHLAFSLPAPAKGKTVYPLLARLLKERAPTVQRLPNLAVAIALVHDEPLEKRVNENRVKAADPVALLDYFAANESRMNFGLRNMPVDLLAYVVDTTSSVADLTWALSKYQGNRNIGETFFNVRYDYNAFSLGRAKDVTTQGYTLPNILRLGGVCADQAHFSSEAAKAIGVPSAYCRAAGVDVSHAWVGFLQSSGQNAWWNFDTGRYESYKNARGNVLDPVTRKTIPDAYVSLLAESISTSEAQRQTAAAFADAATLLFPAATARDADDNKVNAPTPSSQLGTRNSEPGTSPANPQSEFGPARTPSAQSALDLIEFGLRHAPAYQPGWTAVARLASTGQMTLDQKRRWADLVLKLCARKYPDFALATLEPMIKSVEDTAAQTRLWDTLYAMFQTNRPDLSALVRIRQGEMWEKANQPGRAGQAYEEVIRRYVNTSPLALTAVQKAESVLKQLGQDQKVLLLYEQAAKSVMRPYSIMSAEFMKQSNWYKLKHAYATKLQQAGRFEDAKRVLPDIAESAGH